MHSAPARAAAAAAGWELREPGNRQMKKIRRFEESVVKTRIAEEQWVKSSPADGAALVLPWCPLLFMSLCINVSHNSHNECDGANGGGTIMLPQVGSSFTR